MPFCAFQIDEDFIAMYQMNYGFGQPEAASTSENDDVKTTAEITSAQSTADNNEVIL